MSNINQQRLRDMNRYSNQRLALAVARTGYVTTDMAVRVLSTAKRLAKRLTGTRIISNALIAQCIEQAERITLVELWG